MPIRSGAGVTEPTADTRRSLAHRAPVPRRAELGQNGVLLEHVPSVETVALQYGCDTGDVDVAATERTVHSRLHAVGVGELTTANA